MHFKASTAPDGNEDSDINNLKTDCCIFRSTGIGEVMMTVLIWKWRIANTDAEKEFHQSGNADRNVYSRPPCEFKLREITGLC